MLESVPEIAVLPAEDLTRRRRLLDAIAALYGVRFVACAPQEPLSGAVVLFSATREEALAWSTVGVRCLAFLTGPVQELTDGSSDVCFSESACVSPLFRGSRLPDKSIKGIRLAERHPEDEVIAEIGERPVWTCCQQGRSRADLVALPAPILEGSDYLFKQFREDCWASLLPLLHFVAEVSGWTTPPLRACFMFDDPNLHWGSYGYVKFQEIVEAAKIENFHTSFATVPMDAWFVHAPTARLFLENPNLLSLLIHGNDHTLLELQNARIEPPVAMAAQALDRITRLERKSGLSVSRVMAAPHGACNEAAADALTKTGFDAACISTGSLMTRNPMMTWPLSVGMSPAEALGTLPVIPRVNIELGSDLPVRLAAFLGQPIIPVGHHEDLRSGLAVLSRSARFINSVGRVRWLDMKAISESNYSSRRQGAVLEVRMYSRTICVKVPDDVTHVVVRMPWLRAEGENLELQNAGRSVAKYHRYQGEPLRVEEGDLRIRAVAADLVDPQHVAFPQPSIRAIVRRQLCEARDRLRPAFDRLVSSAERN